MRRNNTRVYARVFLGTYCCLAHHRKSKIFKGKLIITFVRLKEVIPVYGGLL